VADPTRPSIMAAREFAVEHAKWTTRAHAKAAAGGNPAGWLEKNDIAWIPAGNTPAQKKAAWDVIKAELEQLKMLMQDDRDRYLAETEAQADGLADYVIAFLGASEDRHPWTIELISCGLSIGNVAYMYFKSKFKRVRPSVLCPGLVPPFGPPRHPAFPSGHSFLGHLLALLLLEIPALQERHGIFTAMDGTPGKQPKQGDLNGTGEIKSPLLWLAQRLAKGRERIGVHYPSDSSGSRHLAAGIWWALLHDANTKTQITCSSLNTVLDRAKAEWA
jgi:membrane-associated phospholipid phosphatase